MMKTATPRAVPAAKLPTIARHFVNHQIFRTLGQAMGCSLLIWAMIFTGRLQA